MTKNQQFQWNHNILRDDKYITEKSQSEIIIKCYSKLNKAENRGKGKKIKYSRCVYEIKQNPTVDFIEHYRNIYASPENFIKRKVDYSRMKVFDEKYRKESERYNSFTNFPKHLVHLVRSIARSGFYFIGNVQEPDKVKCIFCQGVLYGWKISDNPEKDHRKAFPTCPFLLNLNVSNVKYDEPLKNNSNEDPDLKDFNGEICYNVIRENVLIKLSNDIEFDIEYREKTYVNHDHLKYLSLDGLSVNVENGLEYLLCCKCHKSIELLKNVEKLPREIFHHSDCEYLKLVETDIFVENNEMNTEKNQKANQCQIEYSISNDEIEARLDSRIANKFENLNHDRNAVKAVIEKKLRKTGKDYDSTYDFLNDLKSHVDIDNESLEKSNSLEYILSEFSCVVCLDKTVAVVFLPCGHLKTCKSCSGLLVSCPVCRKLIEKRVWGIQIGGK